MREKKLPQHVPSPPVPYLGFHQRWISPVSAASWRRNVAHESMRFPVCHRTGCDCKSQVHIGEDFEGQTWTCVPRCHSHQPFVDVSSASMRIATPLMVVVVGPHRNAAKVAPKHGVKCRPMGKAGCEIIIRSSLDMLCLKAFGIT